MIAHTRCPARLVQIVCLVFAAWCLAGFPIRSATAERAEAWAVLEAPGTVAIMRHALAPGTGDPADFTLGDCGTQRNLNAAGRRQARAIGAAFRKHGIEVDKVLTSQWCRCRDTARLLDLAPVEPFPALNSFFEDRSTADAQTEELRRFLAEQSERRKLVLVTHQVNITALTGVFPASGEIVVIEAADDGEVTVRGRVRIDAGPSPRLDKDDRASRNGKSGPGFHFLFSRLTFVPGKNSIK